jgi:hypothetical protein
LSEFFRGKRRYVKKIFVNKTGPVFSNKKGGDFHKKHQVDKIEESEMNKTTKAVPFPQEYYQKLYNNFSGFTFGIKTHKKINLRENRKEEFKKLKHSFDDVFDAFHNITNPKFYKKKSSVEKRSRTSEKFNPKSVGFQKFEKSMHKSNKKKKKHRVVNRKELERKREEEIKSKIKVKEYVKPERKSPDREMHFDESKRKRQITKPGPGTYEIPGSINLAKGYTFGTKSNLTEILVKTAPSYVLLPSDFDNIEEHATYKYC